MTMPKRKRKPSGISGGRGTGRPPDQIVYGNRLGNLVRAYDNITDARAKADQLGQEGIIAVIRKWYSQSAVYRCGVRRKPNKKGK